MILGKLFGFRLQRAHLKRLHSSTKPLPHSMTVNHDRISLLNSPNDYLNSILQLIDRSTQKIILSALYFGTGEPERRIIAAIHVALSDKKRPNLTCTCIFDFSRTTRPTECNDNKSSLDIFQPLLEAFGERMRLLLYKMPERLSIFNCLIPTQLSEILGVYHCKFCVFDQTVILTGANMSSEYLINRQDRYMLIEQSPNNGIDNKFTNESELKNFLEAFVGILDPHCCHVTHKTLKVKYLDKNSKLQIAKPARKDGKLRNTLGSEINNLLQVQRKGFKKEGEIVENHVSMTMTSFHPLVQHSKCGVFSESNHLCNLLFQTTAPILRTPSRPRGHIKERTEPISENIPLENSVASNEFGNRSSSQCQWSKMVIASPYPSYLPHFMSSLLSASTSASGSASSSKTVHTHLYNSSRTCLKKDDDDDVTVQKIDLNCSTTTKQQNINSNNDLHIDIKSKCETAGFSSKKAAESKHRAFKKSVNEMNSDKLKYFSDAIDDCNDDNDINNNKDNDNINNDNNKNNINNNDNNNNDDDNSNNNNDLMKEGCKMKFIIADERAHGFYKGKGVKQLIPKMHTHAFQTALKNSKKIIKNNSHINNHTSASSTSVDIDEYSGVYDNVSICPYHRAGWTFHVKGIWLFANQLPAPPLHMADYNTTASTSTGPHTPSSSSSTTITTSASYPQPDNTTNPVESGYFRPLAATYIGSSNLGERSCFRDFELGFVLRTNCPILTKKLSEECSRIEAHSSDLSVGFNEYVEGLKNATWYTPYLTKLLRSFL